MGFDIETILGAAEEVPLASVVPIFLCKVWQLVNDDRNNDLVSWSNSGCSFIIHDPGSFAKEVLPNYFKHQRVDSFIRQLNMYGFRKVQNLDNGALKSTSDAVEYSNDNFIRGRSDLLENIKRNKRQLAIPEERPSIQTEQLSVLLKELSNQQTFTNNEFETLRSENEGLISRIESLQSKHDSQQETVSRLINFTIAFMKNNGSLELATKMKRANTLLYNSPKQIQIQEFRDSNMTNACSGSPHSSGESRSISHFDAQKQCDALLPSSGNPVPVIDTDIQDEFIKLEFTPTDSTPVFKSSRIVNRLEGSLNRQHSTLSSIMAMMEDGTP
jgi:hypothetical protein